MTDEYEEVYERLISADRVVPAGSERFEVLSGRGSQ
jgi:hypothetical protein